jgi:hypothetical protein
MEGSGFLLVGNALHVLASLSSHLSTLLTRPYEARVSRAILHKKKPSTPAVYTKANSNLQGPNTTAEGPLRRSFGAFASLCLPFPPSPSLPFPLFSRPSHLLFTLSFSLLAGVGFGDTIPPEKSYCKNMRVLTYLVFAIGVFNNSISFHGRFDWSNRSKWCTRGNRTTWPRL